MLRWAKPTRPPFRLTRQENSFCAAFLLSGDNYPRQAPGRGTHKPRSLKALSTSCTRSGRRRPGRIWVASRGRPRAYANVSRRLAARGRRARLERRSVHRPAGGRAGQERWWRR
ncbi:hypothetical protein ACRAWD_12220 [Caulobacter segnis]